MADDIARIKAVRRETGPDAGLMIDANYALTVPQLIILDKAVRNRKTLWFDKPTIPENSPAMPRSPKPWVRLSGRVKICTGYTNSK